MSDFTSWGLQFDSRRGKRKKESLREHFGTYLVHFDRRAPRGVPETYANCSETARFGTFPFPACIDSLQNTTEVLPFARLSDEWGVYLLITLTGSLLHTSYATRTYRLLYVTSMCVWSKDLGVLF